MVYYRDPARKPKNIFASTGSATQEGKPDNLI